MKPSPAQRVMRVDFAAGDMKGAVGAVLSAESQEGRAPGGVKSVLG